MEIRPTISADLPDLGTVVDRTGLFPAALLGGMIAPFLTGAPGALWLTAVVERAAAGFCYAEPETLTIGTWNMLAIGVHPDRQGSGVGAALVAALERRLCAFDGRVVLADTSGTAAFARTRQFYLKIGYRQVARIPDFWDHGDDKITFWKALTPAEPPA